MPRLLQINVTANWGSTGKIVEQIGQLAIENGWESYIAYGRMVNPSKSRLVKVGSFIDVYIHYLESLFLDNEGLASRRATKRFLREVDKIKPDVVHLHNIHDHFMNYAMLLNYLTTNKIPVVWTQHDQWATTGHCMYIESGCERWKTECHNCPQSRWFSLDRSRRNFHLKKRLCEKIPSLTIVSVSQWLSRNIRSSHLKNRDNFVFYNGIDIQTFSPQVADIHERYNIDKNKKIILGVAAVWDDRKGLKDFYELSRRLPKDEYAIIIVGKCSGVDKISKDCQMVFVDRTQNTLELAQLYTSASVFVNPTYQDNYPTTNLEAIACGTPVITYSTGGSPEAICDGTGEVVNQGDIDGLITSIIKLSSRCYKTQCLRKAQEFDNKIRFNSYIKLYNKLCSERK